MKTKIIVIKILFASVIFVFLGFGAASCTNRNTVIDNNNDENKNKPTHIEKQSRSNLASLIETVEVQAGTFMYGRDGSIIDTSDKLTIVDTFWMGKYPITQGQWNTVMDENPSGFNGTNKYDGHEYVDWYTDNYYIATVYASVKENFNWDKLPVERVSWYDVLVFANKLSSKEGLKPAYRI